MSSVYLFFFCFWCISFYYTEKNLLQHYSLAFEVVSRVRQLHEQVFSLYMFDMIFVFCRIFAYTYKVEHLEKIYNTQRDEVSSFVLLDLILLIAAFSNLPKQSIIISYVWMSWLIYISSNQNWATLKWLSIRINTLT